MKRRYFSLFQRTAHIALDRPQVTLWTFIAVTCTFAMFGAAFAVRGSAEQVRATAQGRGGSMVIYLSDGVGEPAGRQLAAQLAGVPGVERAELVTATESANRLAQALSADAALVEGIDLESLPASIEATLAPGVRDVIAMSPTLQALRDTPGVADVIVEAGERGAARAGGAGPTAMGMPATLALVIAMAIAVAVLRIWLERDADVHRVFDLLGASASFAAAPSILAGALLGIAAAFCAAIAVSVGIAGCDGALASWTAGGFFLAMGAAAGIAAGALTGVSRG